MRNVVTHFFDGVTVWIDGDEYGVNAFAGIAKRIQRGNSRHQREGGAKMFQQGFDAARPSVERYWADYPARLKRRVEAAT